MDDDDDEGVPRPLSATTWNDVPSQDGCDEVMADLDESDASLELNGVQLGDALRALCHWL